MKQYAAPEIEVLHFNSEDVITGSGDEIILPPPPQEPEDP